MIFFKEPNPWMRANRDVASPVKDITAAVLYLTDAATVTGHILYVDGGSHFSRW